MRLSQILNEYQEQCSLFDLEITHLTQDSREVRPGSLFFCGKQGEVAQRYIGEAEKRGAAAIVCTQDQKKGADRSRIVSQNPRRAYSLACSRFWGEPQNGMTLVAVTGTNGKSSTAWLLQHILPDCGLIGTICSRFADQEVPSCYTTPDAGQLYPLLAQMKKAGCRTVVMEASSQALAQERLAGLNFRLGIFTNLSRDHLDQHGNMETYFQVKRSLFAQCDMGLANWDDDHGRLLCREDGLKSYSLFNNQADYTVYQKKSDENGSCFCLVGNREIARVRFAMPGEFFASNAAAALAAANLLGQPLEAAAERLRNCPGVPGRVQIMDCGSFRAMIDYAHTSDGMKKILRLAQSMKPKHLYVVFGCAGERDRGDRPLMTRTVLRYADRAVFTADNPRGESWEQLCGDIPQDPKLLRVFDRKEAIAEAFSWCGKGDLLLLLGKGHERYQALSEKSIYLNEEEVLRDCLKSSYHIEKTKKIFYNDTQKWYID